MVSTLLHLNQSFGVELKIIFILKIIFALTHFGKFFTRYLSDVIVAAYTSATAYIIVITQLFPILGIPNNSEPGQFVAYEVNIF
jgi:MFS superfamily sulfate permease-like transporter